MLKNPVRVLAQGQPLPDAPTSDGAKAILAAAEQLFARKGYEAVSISAIAVKAGVSKANIFHHFRSKRALYLAVLQRARSEMGPLLDRMLAQYRSLRAEVSHFAGAHLSSLLGQERLSRLLLREVLESDPRRARELAEMFGRNFELLVQVLRRAQQGGELRADIDPAAVATLLVGANVFFLQSRHVLRHLRDVDFADDPVRYAQATAEILLSGIANRGRER